MWWQVLKEWGFTASVSEASWCTNVSDEVPLQVQVGDAIVNICARSEGYTVLGAMLAFNFRFSDEIDYQDVAELVYVSV